MADKAGIVELLAEIGNDNLMIQPIDGSLVSMNKRKEHNELAFATEQPFDINGTKQFGMVVWIDRDELTRAKNKVMAS
jgi:hypothetical protein